MLFTILCYSLYIVFIIIYYGYGRVNLPNVDFSSLSLEKYVKIKNDGRSM